MNRNISRDRKPLVYPLALLIILAAALLAGAFSAPDAAAAITSAGLAGSGPMPRLAAQPGCPTEGDEEICTVEIKVQSGNQPVTGAQVYLNFDAASLEVEDANEEDGVQIQPGPDFPAVLRNSVTMDGSNGRIDYSAGKLGGSSYPTGDILLATVRFKVLKSDSTFDGRITVSTAFPRDTFADFGGSPLSYDVPDTPPGGAAQITLPDELALNIQVDSVTLRLVPDTSGSTPDDQATVSVVVEGEDVAKVAGIQFDVDFDPDVAQVVDNPATANEVEGIVRGGSLPSGFFFQAGVDNAAGVAKVAAGRATPIGPSLNSVEVGRITFEPAEGVSGENTVTLSFGGVVIADEQSRVLAYTANDGSITVGGPVVPGVAFASTASSGQESVTSVNLPVTLPQAPAVGETVTVAYAVGSGSTATGGGVDYTLSSGTLNFSAGQTTANINFTVVDDALDEPNETIVVTLSNPSGVALGSPASHTYTILDNDTAPTVAFATGNPTSGPESSTAVTVTVRLGAISGQPVSIGYAVTGGTATQGSDYTLLGGGTLNFAPGDRERGFGINIVNDGLNESNETIVITLSDPTKATLGNPRTYTYTILNDDNPAPAPAGGGGGGFIFPTPTPRPTTRPASTSSPTPTTRPQPTAVPLSEQVRQFIVQVQGGRLTSQQIAAQLGQFGPQNAAQVLAAVDPGVSAQVLAELDAQFAGQVADLLGASALAEIASRMPPDRAASVLDRVNVEALAGAIAAMEEEALLQILPEMSPGRLFQVPAGLLLDRLPRMPVEHLTSETVPQADPNLLSLTALQVSPELTTYSVPQTGESTWTRLASGPTFLERMLGRFSRALANVTVRVEELAERPGAVPDLGEGMVVERFFRVDIENARPEDMLAVHMALSVSRSWLRSNGIHKWSVQLARFDEGHGQWVLFPTRRVEENDQRVLYTAVVPGFSVLAVVGSGAVPQPALEVADLSVSPTLPMAGDAVTVSVRVRATGPEPGVYPVGLWINDTIEQVTTVAVEPGQTVPVSFTVYRPEGSYQVRVDRLLGQVDISPAVAGVRVENPSAALSTPDPFGAALASEATPAPESTSPPGAPSERLASEEGGSPNALIFIIVGVVVGLAAIAFAAQYMVSRRQDSERSPLS